MTVKFVLANRRKDGMTLEKFRYEWGVVHVAIMVTSPGATQRIRRYVQGYSLEDVFPDVPLAYPYSPEHWDGFASLAFDTLEEFLTSVQPRRGGPGHDFSHPSMVVDVTGDEVVVFEREDDTAREEDTVKLVHFLRPAQGVSRARFAGGWRDGYATAVAAATRGAARKYALSPPVPLDASPFEGTPYGQGAFGTYWGIEELSFASREDFAAFAGDAQAQELIFKAGNGLVDTADSFSMVVTDRLCFVSTRGPDSTSVYTWVPPGLEVRSVPGTVRPPVS
jgi:EthD domain